MRLQFGLSAILAVLLVASSAMAQSPPAPGAINPRPAAGPDQPVTPQLPTLQRRDPAAQPPAAQQSTGQPPLAPPSTTQSPTAKSPAVQQPLAPPFQLSAEEEQQVDRVLQAWEKRSADVKKFECSFTRFQYNLVFAPANQPVTPLVDSGTIKYAAPDKGLYKVEGERAEQWICDGKSIFQYNYPEKKVVEYKIPPQVQGHAIVNTPLPFLFGAKAQELKQRYWIRIITPQANRAQETWLEAVPRVQQQTADFCKAELILTNQNMVPAALQLHSPNGQDRTAFKFDGVVINDPMGWLKGDPFRAGTPFGWTKIVEQGAAAQASRVSPPGRR